MTAAPIGRERCGTPSVANQHLGRFRPRTGAQPEALLPLLLSPSAPPCPLVAGHEPTAAAVALMPWNSVRSHPTCLACRPHQGPPARSAFPAAPCGTRRPDETPVAPALLVHRCRPDAAYVGSPWVTIRGSPAGSWPARRASPASVPATSLPCPLQAGHASSVASSPL